MAPWMPKNIEKPLYFPVVSEIQSRGATCPKSYNDSVAEVRLELTDSLFNFDALLNSFHSTHWEICRPTLMQGYCHPLSTNGLPMTKKGAYILIPVVYSTITRVPVSTLNVLLSQTATNSKPQLKVTSQLRGHTRRPYA